MSAVLETRGLTKAFGGLVAVDAVSLEIRAGEPHAVIGPNGAGKSTLVNLLTGHLKPSSGQVLFLGRDITGLKSNRISRLGIGRSYQKTNLFPSLSVFENCRLAAQSRLSHPFRFLRPAAALAEINERAFDALGQVGLADRSARMAADLSHGEQRQLEIAMVLATQPDLLVLDEPLAGMGREESERMVALLSGLAGRFSLLLVEHDMDAVFSLAKMLTVMVNGRVLESGPLDQVRASQAVQDAYLGDGAEAY